MVLLQRAMGKSAKQYHRERVSESVGGLPFFSVDIGTTTVAMELFDSGGNLLDSMAEDNAQLTLGSDVMMRLMHVSEGRGELLTEKIRRQIYEMGTRMLSDKFYAFGDKVAPEQISVVGNTVMCHLFLGMDTKGLMGAPFTPAYEGAYRLKGDKLDWHEWRDSVITVLPGIAAHVGADAAAVLGHLQLWDEKKIQMAVDLGTNAEILLNHHGKVSACSTAAGPAFEGQGISCGKRAGSGVINGVRFTRGNAGVCLDVISEEDILPEPVGICGSGLVDVIAELLHNQLIRPDGYLLSKEEAMKNTVANKFAQYINSRDDGSHKFILYDGREDIKSGVMLTQEDIRAFQLAKGAIRSGMEVLLQREGLSVTDLDELHIAGVFGGFLHPKNAVKSGLLPDLPTEKLYFDGNAAGEGAAKALMVPGFLEELQERTKSVEHVELAQMEEFSQNFVRAMELCAWGKLC
ncbi:MAG: DUF4445 domain-containing protein [Lachnospiraceae bacterium]|nr:DUF4445 domain-containing protein [Lachnospiraceae bacterium]